MWAGKELEKQGSYRDERSLRGHADGYLTIAPERSLWKKEYKRTSGFSAHWIKQEVVLSEPKSPTPHDYFNRYGNIGKTEVRKLRVYVDEADEHLSLLSDMELVLMVEHQVMSPLLFPGLPGFLKGKVKRSRVLHGKDVEWARFWTAVSLVADSGFIRLGRYKADDFTLDEASFSVSGALLDTIYGEHQGFLLGPAYRVTTHGISTVITKEGVPVRVQEVRIPLRFHFAQEHASAVPVSRCRNALVQVKASVSSPKGVAVRHAFLNKKFIALDEMETRLFSIHDNEIKVMSAQLIDAYRPVSGVGVLNKLTVQINHYPRRPVQSIAFGVIDEDTGQYLQPDEVAHIQLVTGARKRWPFGGANPEYREFTRFNDTGGFFMYNEPTRFRIKPDGKHYLLSFAEYPTARAGNPTGHLSFAQVDNVELHLGIVPSVPNRHLCVRVFLDVIHIIRVEEFGARVLELDSLGRQFQA